MVIEGFVTCVGNAHHVFMADRARILQNCLPVECQHAVHMVAPKIQREVVLLFHPQLRLFQENDHQPIEGVDLVLREVILGDDDILLAHARAAPSW